MSISFETLAVPTIEDVRSAAALIADHLPKTPLYPSPVLSRAVGAEIYVKHENHLPTGAFKVRGGVNLCGRLSDSERASGVIAASTGNHGQSVAYGASLFGITAKICVPEGANPLKVRAIEDLGAEVIVKGADFEAAKANADRLSREHGYRYVNSGDEPLLIAGVATHTLEILEAEPEVEVIVVPVGGGSGAAGACVAVQGLSPDVQVIGVQSEESPAAYLSWKQGAPVTAPNKTFAEGLATGAPFGFPQSIMREHLSDFVLVSDEALAQAQLLMIEATRNLVEAAGASPLAAALALKDRLAGKKVALICSGGNATPDQLRALL
jgi:threonine dehydratase